MENEKTKRMEEMKILEQELKTQKKGAAVYKQQQNSQIFFKADREKVFEECKRSMDNLIQEYKAAENLGTPELDPDG